MNINPDIEGIYENFFRWPGKKNKPNSNPIQSQFKPKQTQFKPISKPNKANFGRENYFSVDL
jgi:hypothetical protein